MASASTTKSDWLSWSAWRVDVNDNLTTGISVHVRRLHCLLEVQLINCGRVQPLARCALIRLPKTLSLWLHPPSVLLQWLTLLPRSSVSLCRGWTWLILLLLFGVPLPMQVMLQRSVLSTLSMLLRRPRRQGLMLRPPRLVLPPRRALPLRRAPPSRRALLPSPSAPPSRWMPAGAGRAAPLPRWMPARAGRVSPSVSSWKQLGCSLRWPYSPRYAFRLWLGRCLSHCEGWPTAAG